MKEGGSEPIEPIILGPGGTFGMDPLRAAPDPTIRPIVPDAVETAAEDFFCKAGGAPAAETTEQPRPVPGNPLIRPSERPGRQTPPETGCRGCAIQPALPQRRSRTSRPGERRKNAVAHAQRPG